MNNLSTPKAMTRHAPALFAAVFTMLGILSSLHAATLKFVPCNDEIAAREISVKDSKGSTALKDLGALKRSKSYTVATGKTPLQIIATDRDGAAVTIDLPANIKSPLVLILADSENPSGLRTLVVEDTAAGFPWGSLHFINLTEAPLSVRYETETVTLPQGDAPVQILPEGDARNVGVQIFKEETPDAILYSAVWEHDPNLRKLILVVPNSNPDIKTFELKIIPEDRRIAK